MSRSFRVGLVLFGVLSVADLGTPLLTDGQHPPMAVAVAAAVLGLVSLVLVVSAWRGATRALVPLIVLRVLSAATALPGLFASGVPAAAVGSAVAIVALTAIGVVLVLPALRRQDTVAGAR